MDKTYGTRHCSICCRGYGRESEAITCFESHLADGKVLCSLCSKVIDFDDDLAGIEGGTVMIDAGYGSRFDIGSIVGDEPVARFMVCDDCIEKVLKRVKETKEKRHGYSEAI